MIPIIYFRSSSLNDWQLCQHKYLINYSLGYKSEAGKSAQMGNIFHKMAEILGLRKFAHQQGLKEFIEQESGIILKLEEATPKKALEIAWQHYVPTSIHKYTDADYVQLEQYTEDLAKWTNYWPLNLNIIKPEFFFDFEIKKDWAKYEYNIDGKKVNGYLRLRGTIDLLTSPSNNTLELIDFKTGRPNDWATDEEKTYTKLRYDIQLRLYHKAISELLPQYQNTILTLFFTKREYQGPRSVYFDKCDLEETDNILKKFFIEIKNTQRPKLIPKHLRYKCRFCSFYTEKFEKTGKTYCDFFKDQVVQLGVDKVVKKYRKDSADNYEGGGRSVKDQ